MLEEIKQLYQLSEIERKIRELNQVIDFIPDDIKSINKELSLLQRGRDKFTSRIEIIKAKIDECQRQIEVENEKLEKTTKLLKIAYDQKVYQLAKRMDDQIRKVIKKMEVVISDHQKDIDDINVKVAEIDAQSDKLITTKDKGAQSITVGHDVIDEDLKKLREEERSLRLQVNSEILQLFDSIANRNISPVVVQVNGPRCDACNVLFPDQMFQNILHGVYEICPNCERLMIVKEDVPAVSDQTA